MLIVDEIVCCDVNLRYKVSMDYYMFLIDIRRFEGKKNIIDFITLGIISLGIITHGIIQLVMKLSFKTS